MSDPAWYPYNCAHPLSNLAPSPAQRTSSSLTLRGLRANLQFTIYVLLALLPSFILSQFNTFQPTTNNQPLQHATLTLFNLPYAWLGWL